MIKEEWKSISNGYYSISNLGRVRRDRPGQSTFKGKISSPALNNGYPAVILSEPNKKARPQYVHVLVAQEFIGPRPVGYHINHKDMDKKNPAAENLEYISPEENVKHAFQNIMAKRAAKIAAIIENRGLTK